MKKSTSNMILTKKIIMGEIEQYRKEWEDSGDWRWGIANPYIGVPVGYDVNIHQAEEGEPYVATVYQLKKTDGNWLASTTDEVIFNFIVPTTKEFKEEFMTDMRQYQVEDKSKHEPKVEVLGDIFKLDLNTIISEGTYSVTMPDDSLVNIGDNLITDDGSEHLVAVYRANGEV